MGTVFGFFLQGMMCAQAFVASFVHRNFLLVADPENVEVEVDVSDRKS